MNIIFILIVLFYIPVFVVEVYYDDIQRKREGQSFKTLKLFREQEQHKKDRRFLHKSNWFMIAAPAVLLSLVLIISGFWSGILIAPFLASLRVLILNLGLNIKNKGTSLFYLSSEGLEGKFKGKEWLYYSIWIAVFLFCGILILAL